MIKRIRSLIPMQEYHEYMLLGVLTLVTLSASMSISVLLGWFITR